MYIPEVPYDDRAAVSRSEAQKAYRELLTAIIQGKLDDKGYGVVSNIIDVCAYAAWYIEGFDGEEHTDSYDLFDLASNKTTELLKKAHSEI